MIQSSSSLGRKIWEIGHRCDCCHEPNKYLTPAIIPVYNLHIYACIKCLHGKKPKIGW